ncbi:hypothetical protein CsatA_001164 [Cannabis sativa]
MSTSVEYNFTLSVSFSDHMDQSTSVDLMAIAIIVNLKKQIYTSNGLQDLQELIVVTEEKKPIGLTCWGHFVVNECATITKLIATTPIIVARRLKVTSFNEISLSTKIDSSLMINPNVAKVQTLRRWCTENETFLQDGRMNKKTCLESMSHLIKPQLHLMTPINAIKPGKTYWTTTSITITNSTQTLWYMVCSECKRITTADFNQAFTCIKCTKNATPEPRFVLLLTQSTFSIFYILLSHVL